MKNQKLKSIAYASIIIIALIINTGCTNKLKEEKKTNNSTTNSHVKVNTPEMDIHTAAITGNLEVIEKHIKAGTNLNKKDPQGGSTPLILACVFGKTDVAIALINAGADLNQENNEGSTALHTAAFFCRVEIVKALLAHGADKTLKNNYRTTPLESVSVPFTDVKSIYEFFSKQLAPMGLKLDLDHIKATRPIIVELLK